MITFDDLEAEVRRLANERPDFIYPEPMDRIGCRYNPTLVDGEEVPSCIFGQAFINLGSPVPDDLEGKSITVVLEHFGICGMRSYEANWARWLQTMQDEGKPWADAVRRADRYSPLR